MFLTIAILLALLAAVLVLAATKPATFRVRRTTRIAAPPEKIFTLINDFRRWNAWSPYEQLDPAMKRTLSGATSGKGAVYEWESKGKAGTGRMEITDTSPGSKVAIKLDFVKPFEGHNIAEFALDPAGEATEVTWTMYGPASFFSKLLQVFFDMDKLVGNDFETGLTRLKTLAEA
jgi:uncharacterized protein YndB with AHSA1/START domain